MADIALVFHWTPEAMDKLSPEELMEWRQRAIERYCPDR
jgi:hypothetical protein